MYVRYIPEVIVRGCKTCPYYSENYIDGDTCRKIGWLKIDKNDDIPVNDQIDSDCPLPKKEWER